MRTELACQAKRSDLLQAEGSQDIMSKCRYKTCKHVLEILSNLSCLTASCETVSRREVDVPMADSETKET
eukprot:1009956-Amphidinium_carterae.1